MIKIGITGVNGLLGWHMRSFLYSNPDVAVSGADRATFKDKKKLINFASSCDVIVHFAGMNRGDEQAVAETNVLLVDDLINAFEYTNNRPHVIFSSSTQIYRNTAYGNSKKICSEHFQKWAEKSGARFTNLIIPNVFGEGGKPFYNSVVSTFCFQIANNQKPEIHVDNAIELVHAQNVSSEINKIIKENKAGDIVLTGTSISVNKLLIKLTSFADIYNRQTIPDLNNNFDLTLFNTYRSYLYPDKYPVSVILNKDCRGYLYETVKSLNGGQTFISSTKPGITRGNHYHTKKVERFFVLSGEAKISLRKLFSDKVESFSVRGDIPQYIDIPTFHSHNITNIGDSELITLFWANEIFNPDDPDTFKENV